MDCIGLQALSDSSESDIEESFMRIDHDANSDNFSLANNSQEMEVNGVVEPSKQEKYKLLYTQFTDGLKTQHTGRYLEAEKSFEELLAHSYLEKVILFSGLFILPVLLNLTTDDPNFPFFIFPVDLGKG